MNGSFDVIVVGGGHAGIEAALAGARLGARTALVTHARQEIGRMPCNPAIGGLGKGHLVREIDVLGGEMGRAIDATGIQFRVLNRRKGPAVQAPRAQADKVRYQAYMRDAVASQAGLTVIEGDAGGFVTDARGDGRTVRGVQLADGTVIRGARVVLCTGTFLRGLMHTGGRRTAGGREGAASSEGLSAELERLGFQLKRLKTGTPPRLRLGSLDLARLDEQTGDPDPRPFSFRTVDFAPDQIVCWKAYTGEATHAIIRDNLGRSPLYAGDITGQGPRYCPSIEDKVVRFADRDRHLLFLEPETVDGEEIYVNGLSTSLPADVQTRVVRSIPGLERAELIRYGYAVEYDSVPSWQVRAGLESVPVAGLFLAGQILGTSGYEEAGAQGLVAGVNAVRSLAGQPLFLPGRAAAYVGVLIDDLVTKDISEPYRMFTSRAEHRLRLRCDNAETRLHAAAADLGLLPRSALAVLEVRAAARTALHRLLATWPADDPRGQGTCRAADLLRRPDADLEALGARVRDGQRFMAESENILSTLSTLDPGGHLAAGLRGEVATDCKYDGYISKHERLLRRQEHLDHLEIPDGLDFGAIGALSREAREKLARIRPASLGEASRIDGVRAGDLAVLSVHVKRWRERDGAQEAG